MKIELDYKDMANIIRNMKDDMGAYLAARKAEKEVWQHPWASNGAYTEAILEAMAKYYDKKAEGMMTERAMRKVLRELVKELRDEIDDVSKRIDGYDPHNCSPQYLAGLRGGYVIAIQQIKAKFNMRDSK